MSIVYFHLLNWEETENLQISISEIIKKNLIEQNSHFSFL